MAIDQRALRDALGQFPTGVTVVTADPEGYNAFGVTANSFASVSLDPPLVLWSLQKSSDTFDAFAAAKHFAVNILSDEQQAISNQYAQKNNHDLNAEHYVTGVTGMPLLKNTIASFECEVDVCHDGGDHIIMVGKVIAMHHSSTADTPSPLVFHAGSYRELKA
jgi:flavin reductase (DIM6/NTAB) family NADH-FMN oxidoreductase RutF